MSSFRTTDRIIIVESPSKCAKIETFVNVKGGPSYKCVSTRGHIREIADGLDNIEFLDNHINIKFTTIKEKRAHIKQLAAILQNYTPERIFLATDDDREGEAIAWHVCQVFNLPVTETPRIIFHEITREAVSHGLAHPQRICMKTVAAQQARQVMDILVGYTVTPHLWSNIITKEKRILSAGRCQTPALRLVYDHHHAPKMEPTIRQEISAHFLSTANPVIFTTTYIPPSISQFFEISREMPHKLSADPPRESIRSPPLPFNTSRLLQQASNVLRVSPKQAMDLCQELYQQGFITYLRTDSTQYSTEFIQTVNNYVTKQWGSEYIHPNQSNITQSKTNAVTPHEAIRVTKPEITSIPRVDKIPKLHLMYQMIWLRTMESVMADARYEVTKLYMTCSPTQGTIVQYTSELETPIFLGWQKLSPIKLETVLPIIQTTIKNALLDPASIFSPTYMETVAHVSGAPTPHYSEALLVHKLEEYGIGRPSTYAGILQILTERGYVVIQDIAGTPYPYKHYMTNMRTITESSREIVVGAEKQKLVIQPIGIRVIEYLTTAFDRFFQYPYTKSMEEELDNVDESTWCKLCLDTRASLNDIVVPVPKQDDAPKEVASTKRDPPKPENILRYVNTSTSIRTGKFGPYVYFKTDKMAKPAFYSLTKFGKDNYMTCDEDILLKWLKDTYGRNFS